jgi:hypothetical protein
MEFCRCTGFNLNQSSKSFTAGSVKNSFSFCSCLGVFCNNKSKIPTTMNACKCKQNKHLDLCSVYKTWQKLFSTFGFRAEKRNNLLVKLNMREKDLSSSLPRSSLKLWEFSSASWYWVTRWAWCMEKMLMATICTRIWEGKLWDVTWAGKAASSLQLNADALSSSVESLPASIYHALNSRVEKIIFYSSDI